MRARKLLAVSAALVASTAGLAACGGDSGGSGGSSSSGGPVTMTLWHNATSGTEGPAFWKKTVADFEAAHPNVKIEIQAIQNEDFDGKLQTALNSGDAPDIFLQRGGGKMAAMAEAGQLMDITDSITEETKKVLPAGAFTSETIDGKIYAMPGGVLPGGFFYAQDLFTKAGITQPPATMEDLQAAVTKLKATGVAPIALGAKDAWPAAHYYYFFALRACSSKTITDTAKSLEFTDPCWLKAGQDLQNFAATKPFNQGFLTTSAQQGAGSSAGLVANHKAAMELMGAWDPGVIGSLTPDKKPLKDLAWFPFPSVPGGQGEPGAILGGIDGNSCSAKAPKAECTAFLNYLVTTDVQKANYAAFHSPPVNTEAQKAITEPYLKSIVEAFSKAPFTSQWLDTVYGQNVGNALNIAVVDMLAGKGDAKHIVDTVQNAAKKA
jgi:raffinose/stachyose/melibiose transport system substrate-binding protein